MTPLYAVWQQAFTRGNWDEARAAWQASRPRARFSVTHPWVSLVNALANVVAYKPAQRDSIDAQLAEHLPELMARHALGALEWPAPLDFLSEQAVRTSPWTAGSPRKRDRLGSRWTLLARLTTLQMPKTVNALIAQGANPWATGGPNTARGCGGSAWIAWAQRPMPDMLDGLLDAPRPTVLDPDHVHTFWVSLLRTWCSQDDLGRRHGVPISADIIGQIMPRLLECLPVADDAWADIFNQARHDDWRWRQSAPALLAAFFAHIPPQARAQFDAKMQNIQDLATVRLAMDENREDTMAEQWDKAGPGKRVIMATQLIWRFESSDAPPTSAEQALWQRICDDGVVARPPSSRSWANIWQYKGRPPAAWMQQYPQRDQLGFDWGDVNRVDLARWAKEAGFDWPAAGSAQSGWLDMLKRAVQDRDVSLTQWCLEQRPSIPESLQRDAHGVDWATIMAAWPNFREGREHLVPVSRTDEHPLVARVAAGKKTQLHNSLRRWPQLDEPLYQRLLNIAAARAMVKELGQEWSFFSAVYEHGGKRRWEPTPALCDRFFSLPDCAQEIRSDMAGDILTAVLREPPPPQHAVDFVVQQLYQVLTCRNGVYSTTHWHPYEWPEASVFAIMDACISRVEKATRDEFFQHDNLVLLNNMCAALLEARENLSPFLPLHDRLVGAVARIHQSCVEREVTAPPAIDEGLLAYPAWRVMVDDARLRDVLPDTGAARSSRPRL